MRVRRAIPVCTRLPGACVVMGMGVCFVGRSRFPGCIHPGSRCQANQHLERPEDREGERQRSQRECSNPGDPGHDKG